MTPPYPSPGPGYRPQGLALYTGVNDGGAQQVFNSAVPDLRRMNFDNRAASLRLPPGEVWEVCDGVNFTGRCMTLNQNAYDLSQFGFRNRVRSIRPLPGGVY